MANYTEHYQLHQWEPEDSFLRTDFNEDFAKMDGVLAELDGRKPEIVWGSYSGDNTEQRSISLGFPPKGILLYCRETESVYAFEGLPRMSHTGDKTMLAVTADGFQIHYGFYRSGLNDIDYRPVTNKSGEQYRYLAVK